MARHVVFLLLFAVVIDTVEEVGVEVGPLLKGILVAEESRCHVMGNEGRLDKQGTRAAHRVYEVGLAMPACHEYHASCQHFVQRSLHRFLTIAPAME